MKSTVLVALLSATMMTASCMTVFAADSTASAAESAVSTAERAAGSAESSADSREVLSFKDAVGIALADAGLTLDDVKLSKELQTCEDGKAVYEIEFIVPGEGKYEYVIDCASKTVADKESDDWEDEDDEEYKALIDETKKYFDFEADDNQAVTMAAVGTLIDECAKDRETELVYYKSGVEYDDGKTKYVLCAMLPKEMKFEYEFDMENGEVIDSEKEAWESEDDAEFASIL